MTQAITHITKAVDLTPDQVALTYGDTEPAFYPIGQKPIGLHMLPVFFRSTILQSQIHPRLLISYDGQPMEWLGAPAWDAKPGMWLHGQVTPVTEGLYEEALYYVAEAVNEVIGELYAEGKIVDKNGEELPAEEFFPELMRRLRNASIVDRRLVTLG